MKRSEINEILGHTRQFFSMHDVHLPPFASFPPARWQQLDGDAWQEVFDLRLGWDVTAFGGDNFAAQGLTLFALRNGSPGGKPWDKCYAEKIMHVREGQVTPLHFHWRKREDIINRGGGNLIVELWNADEHEQKEEGDIRVASMVASRPTWRAAISASRRGRASACRPACTTVSGVRWALATCWWVKSPR